MASSFLSQLPTIVKTYEVEILKDWVNEQQKLLDSSKFVANELMENAKIFLSLFQEALQSGNLNDIESSAWQAVRQCLEDISRARTEQGFTFIETATFVFSLKQPLFTFLQKEYTNNSKVLSEEMWRLTQLLDKLGLFTASVYQKSRERIIKQQQEELLELSTPVIKLWEKILALPMIGTLDSNRTQIVMENLLQKIIEHSTEVAIIDITGVPNVDTLVAQHLLKTVTAARLMGTECIISGIRPQIAQTIVHLGVNLEGVLTKATLAEAFKIALALTKQTIEVKAKSVSKTHSN